MVIIDKMDINILINLHKENAKKIVNRASKVSTVAEYTSYARKGSYVFK
jgi:hypothetical protein